MEHRFIKPVAMLGVTLFATSVFATSFQATHQVTAHAASEAAGLNQDEATALYNYEAKTAAFQYGYQNLQTSKVFNLLAKSGTSNYYDAGKAASLGVFYALTGQNLKSSDTHQDIIQEAMAAAKQGILDVENHAVSQGSYTQIATQDNARAIYIAQKQNKAPIPNQYGQVTFNNDIDNPGYDDTTNIVNHYAYTYAVRAVSSISTDAYNSKGYQYGYQAFLNGGPFYQYGYSPNLADGGEIAPNNDMAYYIEGYNDARRAQQAIDDIHNNTQTTGITQNTAAYIAAYVGYQIGRYNYGFNNNLAFATNAQKYQRMDKVYQYGYNAGVKDRPATSVSGPTTTPASEPTTSTNHVTVTKHHKKVTKKHVTKKHHKKVAKKHVRKHVKKAKVLFKVKVKAHKLYAYKSTNFKHHFGRKVEHKNTKLKVYGIVRKHHKTYYRVYGHRLILANKHTVTKVH